MSVLFGRIGITAAPIGRRCFIALAVAFCDVAAVQLCFRFDVLRVFGAEYDLSCPSLGLSQRVCWALLTSTRFHNRSFSYPLLLIFDVGLKALSFLRRPQPLFPACRFAARELSRRRQGQDAHACSISPIGRREQIEGASPGAERRNGAALGGDRASMIERSLPHGHVAAVLGAMARKLGLDKLLRGPEVLATRSGAGYDRGAGDRAGVQAGDGESAG